MEGDRGAVKGSGGDGGFFLSSASLPPVKHNTHAQPFAGELFSTVMFERTNMKLISTTCDCFTSK